MVEVSRFEVSGWVRPTAHGGRRDACRKSDVAVVAAPVQCRAMVINVVRQPGGGRRAA